MAWSVWSSYLICLCESTFYFASIVGSGWWKTVGRRHPGSIKFKEVWLQISQLFVVLYSCGRSWLWTYACIKGHSSMLKWSHGWERQSTFQQSLTDMVCPMRKWKSSKFYLNIKWVHLDIIYKFQIVSFLLLCITEMHFLLGLVYLSNSSLQKKKSTRTETARFPQLRKHSRMLRNR